jgi:hypothetical protein
LGRKVSADGLEIGNQHLKPVQDWVRPTSTRHVERFLGFANYHRSFISQYALLASSFEYQMFPAKVSRHSSINGKGKTSLTVTVFKAR